MPIDNPPIVRPKPTRHHNADKPPQRHHVQHWLKSNTYREPVNEPVPGLGAFDPHHVVFKGALMRADVADAMTDAQLVRTITGASQVTFTINDHTRRFIRSDYFGEKATLVFDGLLWEMVGSSKSADDLTVTFEDAGVADLRAAKKHIVAAAGTTTRVQFARHLVDQVPWLGFRGDNLEKDDTKIKEQLVSGARKHGHKGGSKTKGPKNAWASLVALASERQWEMFLDEGIVYFGSDKWLAGLGDPLEISEDDPGILSIDFSSDANKKASAVTITALTHRWFARPGKPVVIKDLGPLVDKDSGPWLVSEIDRGLFDETATISLKRPTRSLPEPKPASTGSGSGGSGVGLGGSQKADAFATYMLKFRGDRYTWGGSDPQTGFDCSGFIVYGLHHFGISMSQPASSIYAACRHVPIAEAVGIRGALLFHPPGFGGDPVEHIAVSLGNGSTIEARGSAYGVVVVPGAAQRFNKGALVRQLGPYGTHAPALLGGGFTGTELKMFNRMSSDAAGVQKKIRAIWGSHADIGIAIASCESSTGQNVDGHGNRVGCNPSGLGCGVMQINPQAHPQWDRSRLATDQAFNIWCGLQLFQASGTVPWVSSEGCWGPILRRRGI